MDKHKCNKETELQKMQDDIGFIKKALTEDGGGGLVKTVAANRDFRKAYQAKSQVYRFMVGGGWLTTLILWWLKS